MFILNCPCDYEICIGDNSTEDEYIDQAKGLADVYVRITDKELYRMGIPWGHNRIIAEANSYKIFYVDSDEYPVWIHPNIEDHYDLNYILNCIRYDFLTKEEVFKVANEIDNSSLEPPIIELENIVAVPQDRMYNSRYVTFNGLCHSTFHAPNHFRERSPSVFLLHNKTVRDAKDIDRMRAIIREQYSRMLINPTLKSSDVVQGWAKDWASETGGDHMFSTFEKFIEHFDGRKDNK
jgi:hypothetical protein